MVDFETNALTFRDAGIQVIAASVDSVEKSATLFGGLHLNKVQVFAELDMRAVAESTGASFHESDDRSFLHATGWLINPEDEINTSCYSTGPIGRFTASEILRKVAFEKLMRSRS